MSAVATSDSQAIALLCAPLKVGDAKPLNTAEWARVATVVHGSEVGHPAGLLGMKAEEVASVLAIDLALAERIAHLLDRGGPFAFELERLADRGIWLLTRADDDYPGRLRKRLSLKAPPVLFGSGSRELVNGKAAAIVGSREADEAALAVARAAGAQLAREQVAVVSGGARGVDRAAMEGAASSGGVVVGFVADSLIRFTQQSDVRQLLADDQLALVTAFAPDARFTVGSAMARNKLIYCAADAAIVVSTAQGSGGTWTGAIEALKARWVPVWTWIGESAPPGNLSLVAAGAVALDEEAVAGGSLYDSLISASASASSSKLSGASRADPDWSQMLSFLQTPRSEVELCDQFDLKRDEVRSRMKRGVESGEVSRTERPVRYAAARGAPLQPTLFDEH
jgi:predicted Rossmann fold nucleotide-binding protein DprA/Smf involved in DNA uptake